jgi:hypothetical protein
MRHGIATEIVYFDNIVSQSSLSNSTTLQQPRSEIIR